NRSPFSWRARVRGDNADLSHAALPRPAGEAVHDGRTADQARALRLRFVAGAVRLGHEKEPGVSEILRVAEEREAQKNGWVPPFAGLSSISGIQSALAGSLPLKAAVVVDGEIGHDKDNSG